MSRHISARASNTVNVLCKFSTDLSMVGGFTSVVARVTVASSSSLVAISAA